MGPGRLDSHTSPAGSGQHKTQLLVVASVGVLKHPARVSCNKVIHQGTRGGTGLRSALARWQAKGEREGVPTTVHRAPTGGRTTKMQDGARRTEEHFGAVASPQRQSAACAWRARHMVMRKQCANSRGMMPLSSEEARTNTFTVQHTPTTANQRT